MADLASVWVDIKGKWDAFEKSAQSELGAAGKRMGKGLGLAMVAGTAAAGGLMAKGFFDALDAGSQAAKIEGALGITPERAAELGGIASGLYRDAWGTSLGEVTDAVIAAESTLAENLGASGIDGATEKALAFAQTFDTDVTGAIDAAGQAVESGLAANSDEAFDLLVSAFQQAPAAMRDEIAEASNEYGGFFTALGLSGEEAFGLLASAADSGVYGIDKTGDALKELSIRATDMSTASVDAFSAAGLNAEDMAAAFLEGGDTARGALDDTIEGLLGIEDPVERSNAAIALFGTPLEDLGTTEIPEFLESLQDMGAGLGDVEGAAGRMVDSVGDTPAAKLEAFKRRALGGLADFAANTLVPAFDKFADWGNRNWPTIRATVTNAADRIRGALEPIADALARSLGWLIDNRPILIGAGVAIGAIMVGAFGAWAIAAGAAALATIAATWPIIAIGVAIAALVAGVIYAYTEWDWFRETVDAVASFMTDTLWPIIKTVTRAVGRFLVAAVQIAIDVFGALVGAARAVWRWMQQVWDRTAGFRSFLAGAFVAGVNAARNVLDVYVAIYRTAWRWAKSLWDRTEGLRGFLAGAFKVGVDIAKTAVGALWLAFNRAWRWAKTLWDRTEGLRSFLSGAFKTGIDIATGVVDEIKTAFDNVAAAVQWVIDKIESMIGWIDKIPKPDLGFLPGFAKGGQTAGGAFIAGEEGPEIVFTSRRHYVATAQETRQMLHAGSDLKSATTGGGGGDMVTINHYGQTVTPATISQGLRMARMR